VPPPKPPFFFHLVFLFHSITFECNLWPFNFSNLATTNSSNLFASTKSTGLTSPQPEFLTFDRGFWFFFFSFLSVVRDYLLFKEQNSGFCFSRGETCWFHDQLLVFAPAFDPKVLHEADIKITKYHF
jgi:hypothetical protein